MAFIRSSTPEPRPSPLRDLGNSAAQESYSYNEPAAAPIGLGANIDTGFTVISSDLTILGENLTIISKDRLQIDGEIRGDVTGRMVKIGAGGSVVGVVSAETIEVFGAVAGAIRAGSVMLHHTSRVDGEIIHNVLGISEGASFDGSVRRAKTAAELIPNLDANSYPGGRK